MGLSDLKTKGMDDSSLGFGSDSDYLIEIEVLMQASSQPLD